MHRRSHGHFLLDSEGVNENSISPDSAFSRFSFLPIQLSPDSAFSRFSFLPIETGEHFRSKLPFWDISNPFNMRSFTSGRCWTGRRGSCQLRIRCPPPVALANSLGGGRDNTLGSQTPQFAQGVRTTRLFIGSHIKITLIRHGII